MIPQSLIEPIDYESFYASPETDEVQRFKALSTVLERLGVAEWLKGGIHSVHLIDWDWRGENRKYNHRHVPMMILTPKVFDWYREYGVFLDLDRERADRFSFARFFFELAPRRDVVVVRFDLDGEELYAIRRDSCCLNVAQKPGGPGAALAPETVEIRLNLRLAREMCRPLQGLLEAFRRKHPVRKRPGPGEIISLADSIGALGGHVSDLIRGSREAERSRDEYLSLPERPLDKMGSGFDLLIAERRSPGQESAGVTTQDMRVLLANLAVHAFLVPESLTKSLVAIVPGIAQINDGTPMVAGGFLIHYDPPKPHTDLADWLLLATAWAREKATFDLVERNRRQQLGTFIHSISNDFGGIIARVRALEPAQKSSAVAHQLEDMQGDMLAATASVRGEAKNTDHVRGCPAELLPEILNEVLSRLAGNEDVLNNLFGRHVPYESALRSIREAVDCHKLPGELEKEWFAFSRRLVREILGVLLKNALEHTPWASTPDEKVEVSFGSDGAGLYVDVANPAGAESLPHLERIASALRRKRDPDVVGRGMKTLTIRCTNERLPWPSMNVDRVIAKVALRCHLARPWDAQQVPPIDFRRRRIADLTQGGES